MIELSLSAYQEYFEEEEQSGIILFSRKTCHVCQQVHPLIEELENEFKDVSFYHVDSETNESLMNKCKIKGVPQVLYIKNGEEVYRLAGEHTYDEFAEGIEEHLYD